MVCIRQATAADLIAMQMTNMWCLPENYQLRYYLYHLLSWPQLLQVAENHKGEIIGYVLSKMEEREEADTGPAHGHITSLAVLRTYRKCGIATKMMKQAHLRQKECFDSHHCSLHVRYTNRAAFHLYSLTLGYEVSMVEKGYYADGEDAYSMKCVLKTKKKKRIKQAAVAGVEAKTETPAIASVVEQVAERTAQNEPAQADGTASAPSSSSSKKKVK